MATDQTPAAVQSANALMDEVRRSTNPLLMRVYGRLILTFISPIFIMIVTGGVVSFAREVVGNATSDWLLISAVTFAGLMIGFLIARAVWQLMEHRYHGLALFRQFLAVASAMTDLKKSVKRQVAGGTVPAAEFNAQSQALEHQCAVYLTALREAGIVEQGGTDD